MSDQRPPISEEGMANLVGLIKVLAKIDARVNGAQQATNPDTDVRRSQ